MRGDRVAKAGTQARTGLAVGNPVPSDDAALLRRVAEGESAAFEELYRRHADAAWRAAQSILSRPHDAADAVAEAFAKILRAVRAGRVDITHFRAYLLTTTRHVAIDRRSGVEDAHDVNADLLGHLPALDRTPAEVVIDLTDESLVGDAYRGLPDRWQRVLWLTEVEGLRPADVAARLGTTPNGVAQLAFRARAGLRRAFVQAHAGTSRDAECTLVVRRLGAFVLGEASAREERIVSAHLETCEACRTRRDEVAAFTPAAGRFRALAAIGLAWAALVRRATSLSAPWEAARQGGQPLLARAAAGVAALTLTTGAIVAVTGPSQRGATAPPTVTGAGTGAGAPTVTSTVPDAGLAQGPAEASRTPAPPTTASGTATDDLPDVTTDLGRDTLDDVSRTVDDAVDDLVDTGDATVGAVRRAVQRVTDEVGARGVPEAVPGLGRGLAKLRTGSQRKAQAGTSSERPPGQASGGESRY